MKLSVQRTDSDFGFRPSFGFRISDFGFPASRPALRRSAQEAGVALVITLIMLAVITFMAIAFLVLSRGERSSVTTATDQSLAKLAADNALERAQAELVAPMIASGNFASGSLLVSTNFINPLGFNTGGPGYANPTNVAYSYLNGAPLSVKDSLQNLSNLLINPRPPVFIVTNRLTGASDFRYYLDLNRNGMFDPSGLVTNIDYQGRPTTRVPLQGDPQWIGGLEFPDRHHSPDNRFIYRYAYLVVPTSQALDINYIHNAARNPAKASISPNGDDFLRNQGVGTWEINLAAFLYDLNTNTYAWGGQYVYRPQIGSGSSFISGNAFVDAASILAVARYGGYNSYQTRLPSVRSMFFNGPTAFANHAIDAYTAGPIMVGTTEYSYNPDVFPTPRSVYPWPGADNTNHIFSLEDLLNIGATTPPPNFASRLQNVSTNIDTYDRYTFYRLLSQLGTDTAPEPPGKINLNYDNLVQRNGWGIASATNFFAWQPVDFFTNAANMLLTNAGLTLSLTNLQVYPTNFYTPSVHRLLQLAANIYDATTNRALLAGQTNAFFPSVFRPIFRRQSSGTNTVVVIAGYTEVRDAQLADALNGPVVVELDQPNVNLRPFLQYGTPFQNARTEKSELMVSGIPLIIGAKKGLPNFNELAMQTKIYVSRLLEFRRAPGSSTGPIVATNQMYVVNVTNTFGLEAWNSYLSSFPRNLKLVAAVTMAASMTNELGGNNIVFSNRLVRGVITNIPAYTWRGWVNEGQAPYSMVLPFAGTNEFAFLANSTVLDHAPWVEPETHIFPTPTRGSFYSPHWWLNLNTRLRFILVDTSVTPNRIIDYVNINHWDQPLDVTTTLMRGNTASVNPGDYKNPANQWLTNRLGNSLLTSVPTYGVMNQIQVGLQGLSSQADWQSFSQDPYSGLDAESAVDGFRFNLLGWSPIYPKDQGKAFFKSNVFYAPFDPYRPIYIHTSWQANDPLVHYTAGDLLDLNLTSLNPNIPDTNHIDFATHVPALENLGRINKRYRPWISGTANTKDPLTELDPSVKDWNVNRSDDWDFPTNKFPNIGWLGRVHRGTPWQTVFLKSTNFVQKAPNLIAGLQNWSQWTGNPQLLPFPAITNMVVPALWTNWVKVAGGMFDSSFTTPTNDWLILDLFTTAFNDNSGRGQLSINQTNLAGWSAVLSGVSVLSNAPTFLTNYFIEPAAVYNPLAPPLQLPPIVRIVNGINNARTNFPNNAFQHLGEILSAPELTMASPYLGPRGSGVVNDAVLERIPQQILGLIHAGEQPPKYVIYSYGQALKPAPRSLYMGSGPFFGMVTNYQITAEVATRAVVRVDGAPTKPRTVIESFNVLPPD